MAPLPPTFNEDASSLVAAIQRRMNDVTDTQLPRLRSCKESFAVQQQYAAELQEDMDTITRMIQVITCLSTHLCLPSSIPNA